MRTNEMRECLVGDGEVPLATACMVARCGTMTGRDRVLRGDWRGRQASNGRWFVEEASVHEHMSRTSKASPHRAAA